MSRCFLWNLFLSYPRLDLCQWLILFVCLLFFSCPADRGTDATNFCRLVHTTISFSFNLHQCYSSPMTRLPVPQTLPLPFQGVLKPLVLVVGHAQNTSTESRLGGMKNRCWASCYCGYSADWVQWSQHLPQKADSKPGSFWPLTVLRIYGYVVKEDDSKGAKEFAEPVYICWSGSTVLFGEMLWSSPCTTTAWSLVHIAGVSLPIPCAC